MKTFTWLDQKVQRGLTGLMKLQNEDTPFLVDVLYAGTLKRLLEFQNDGCNVEAG